MEKSSLGISPLIASVLLIAFTMTIAMVAGPFFTNTLQDSQKGVSDDTQDIVKASSMDLSIEQVKYDQSNSNLSVTLMNTGDEEIENISITATGRNAYNQQYDTSLRPREIEVFEISVKDRFIINKISASLQKYPVSAELDRTFTGMRYEWYDTSQHYNDVSHPNTKDEFDKFFNESLTNVSLEGKNTWNRRIHWWSNGWDAKPSYLPGDGFSWKAEGYIYAPQTGTYTIGLDADDSTDVYIDGERVVHWYGGHGTSGDYSHNNKTKLEKGWHSFKARMEEGGGGDGISVAWKTPSSSNFDVISRENYVNYVYKN